MLVEANESVDACTVNTSATSRAANAGCVGIVGDGVGDNVGSDMSGAKVGAFVGACDGAAPAVGASVGV